MVECRGYFWNEGLCLVYISSRGECKIKEYLSYFCRLNNKLSIIRFDWNYDRPKKNELKLSYFKTFEGYKIDAN